MIPPYRMLVLWAVIQGFVVAFLSSAAAQTGSGVQPAISLEVRFERSLLPELKLEWLCSAGTVRNQALVLERDQELELGIPDFIPANTNCQVLVRLPKGYSVEYHVTGDSISLADRNGCQFSQIDRGHRNACRIEVSQEPVRLTVYKKWIGPSGEEEDVEISLECESGEYSGFRYINEGSPDGWDILQVGPEGILCNVSETVRDSFRPDIIDCQGLWILPGKSEECTLLNTKIVKRIEMLNRYGKVVMILLVLGIGLIAARRLS